VLAKRSRCGVWIPGYGGRLGSGWPGLKAPISVDGRQSEKSGRSEVSPPGGQRPAGGGGKSIRYTDMRQI
jgi:hypothetical protein